MSHIYKVNLQTLTDRFILEGMSSPVDSRNVGACQPHISTRMCYYFDQSPSTSTSASASNSCRSLALRRRALETDLTARSRPSQHRVLWQVSYGRASVPLEGEMKQETLKRMLYFNILSVFS